MSGNKREQRDRESGLTFSWRTPETCGWSTTLSVVLVALLTVGLIGAIRVRVVPPPRVIERHASLMLLPETDEGRSWAVSVDEQGPFPSRYDLGSDPAVKEIEEKTLLADIPRKTYRPVLRDLPQESGAPPVPTSLRGERFFPEEPPPERTGPPAQVSPLAPVLLPLSTLPASAWPATYPPFETVVSPAMAAKSMRFMVEIGSHGRVLQQQSIEVGGDDATRDFIRRLGDWIGRLQFGSSAKPGWIAVEVAFNRNR